MRGYQGRVIWILLSALTACESANGEASGQDGGDLPTDGASQDDAETTAMDEAFPGVTGIRPGTGSVAGEPEDAVSDEGPVVTADDGVEQPAESEVGTDEPRTEDESDGDGTHTSGSDAASGEASEVGADAAASQDPPPTDPDDAAGEPTDPDAASASDGELAEDEEMSTPEDGNVVTSAEAFSIAARLASELDPAAPTTVGIVTFTTTIASVQEAYIEFGLDESYGMIAPVDLAEPEHRTLLLGMKPERDYHYRIVVDDGVSRQASADRVLRTGAPTDLVSIGDFEIIDAEKREPGFIVASYWQGDSASVGFILDADGEIVWWHDFGSAGIARMRMSATGKHMWMTVVNNGGGALQRVGLDGLGGETYAATSGSHDLTPVEGETMAYLDYGESDCDSIFLIDPSGTTTEVWESDELFGGDGGGGPRGLGGAANCHSNALRYSQDEDIFTFSDVSRDIVGISRDGELVWRLTEIVPGGVAEWGGRNHGHHLLGDTIVIYANDGGQSESSAAIEYSMSTGERLFYYDSGDGSANLGDVQRLPGGNTLVTHSNDSVVHEVDAEGQLVMAFHGNVARIGYTLWRPTLYGPPPDISL